ncbi:alpha/beta hydrolase [Paenibacillus sp. SYP-B4298]|uniref:alpha/beta hydrolase n=1 Tax=Paenibacillus sp. SYP-B4298 TaxID=2996034 RepID=UPI0022DD5C4B|nr:alpha/beta hydrolase [Paenibacillus sp. SYP-B4298]
MNTTILSPVPLDGGFSPVPQPVLQPHPGRRPEPASELARTRHIAIAVVSSFVVFILFALVAFHGYVAWMLAYPYVAPLTSNPMLAKNLPYHDVQFSSASGKTTVDGWYIPAADASAKTVIFSHGYGANREETWVPMYELAELLHRLKYNVLMFDYGYASAAHKSPATGGQEESQQLLAAIQYARSAGAQEVVVWGFSMGAGTALQTALQTNQIDAMILDSTFLPDPDTLFYNVQQIIDLPRYPSLALINKLLPLWTNTSLDAIPAAQVKQNAYSIPIYMIHGTADSKAPVAVAEQIFGAQRNPLSRSWIVQEGQHELLYRAHPKEYIQRAAVFLSQVESEAARSTQQPG